MFDNYCCSVNANTSTKTGTRQLIKCGAHLPFLFQRSALDRYCAGP